MKRRFLTGALIAALSGTLVFGLAACGGEHTHSTTGDWITNSTQHWHNCDEDNVSFDLGDHVYDNDQDTTCNVCGYVRTVTPGGDGHTHHTESAYQHDDTNHWHVCDDDDHAQFDVGTHEYDDEEDTDCNVCGYVRTLTPGGGDDSHTHHTESAYQHDDTNHWHVCDDDDHAQFDVGTHEYDDEEDTDCNVCGYVRTLTPGGDGHTHHTEAGYQHDDTNHWHVCDDDDHAQFDVGTHEYDDDDDDTCNVCDYVREVFTAPTVRVIEELLNEDGKVEIVTGAEFDYTEVLDIEDDYDEINVLNFSWTSEPDFDIDSPAVGEYTLTITVTNSKGRSTTVTMEVSVVAPKPGLVVEVETEREADWVTNGHESGKMVFANESYIVIDENTELTTEAGIDENKKPYPANVVYYKNAVTGVFHNTTDDTVTLYMQGSGGAAVILDSTGYVIEARDGMNGRLVNKDHPVRTSGLSSYEREGESAPVPSTNHAYYLDIPAGGFAIIVNNDGTFGTAGEAHQDGRWWLTNNLVAQYGYKANLYFEDSAEHPLTVYANHSPIVLDIPNINVKVNDGSTVENLREKLRAGITYTDDSGTFESADDVTSGLDIELVGDDSEPTFDNAKEGSYVFTLKVTDEDGEITEFKRTVVVQPATPEVPTIEIKGERYNHETKDILVNPATVAKADDHYAIIYTSYFVGTFVSEDFAPYFVVDAEGKVVETYHPVNGKTYTKGGDGNIVETSKGNTNVLNGVKIPVGGYVVLCVYTNQATDFNTPMRTEIGKADRMLGETVTLHKIEWQPVIKATKGGDVKELKGGNFIVNRAASSESEASKATALIYDKTYTGSIVCNGNGAAVIVNKTTKKIVSIYDGANGKYFNSEFVYPTGDTAANHGFTTTNFAEKAFEALQEDEYVIIFPNNGSNQAGSPRSFGLDLRSGLADFTIDLVNLDIPDATPVDPATQKSITAGSAKLDVTTVAVDVDAIATATDYELIIYTHGFEGTLATDSHGIAIIVSTENKIVKVYDGANGKCYDQSNVPGTSSITCTPSAYISEANAFLKELQDDGSYMVVFPKNGPTYSWANSNVRAYDKQITLTNISLDGE